ncbi:MAG: saccharopine dehydrogenase NADP-binding domain-containing protein [Armatimonadetes bacterium]|nr:saccharopine dehydrogenase NADP-binding domain-containing protein [Armatimonadota bacterium]
MKFRYAVLGAGRQGTAAAYDMARWGEAARILLADASEEAAERAAERVNRLVGRPAAEARQLDATDLAAVERLLAEVDSCLSAVPYYYNLDITQAAIRARTHLCDLGGHTGIAREQHALDAQARGAGLSIVPNCGQVPGMGTSLMVYAMELLDRAEEVYLWDGGLPCHPQPPFQYSLTFNIEGLTNEYAEPAVFLRDGVLVEVAPMSEPEEVEFPEPIGRLEAFVTGGGLDTMPWTYRGRLRTLQNKTLRYPGHYAQLKAYYDLGLWGREPVSVRGLPVVPRDVFHTLFEPQVRLADGQDMILVRVHATGTRAEGPAIAEVELIDYHDPETGFTAMERCTGWSAAIVAEMAARGELPKGSAGVETQVPAGPYVRELQRRGLRVRSTVSTAEVSRA